MASSSPRRALLAAAAIAAAVALASCGESEDEKFVKAVNEVCSDGEKKIDDADSPEDIIEISSEYVADLRAIDAPESKRADYEEWLKIQETLLTELTAALRARDRERFDRIDEDLGDDEARELGLGDDCA